MVWDCPDPTHECLRERNNIPTAQELLKAELTHMAHPKDIERGTPEIEILG